MVVAAAFVGLIILGMPIAWVLGLTAIILLLLGGQPAVPTVGYKIYEVIDSFTLSAIPFFVLLGEIMNKGGISRRLIDYTKVLLGHVRGGLYYVNVFSSMLMAAFLGSANADVAITGRVLVPQMVKEGYDEDFSVAVTATSSLMGPLIPPSLTFVVYGVVAGVSIGGLFLAGIVPGILIGVALAVFVFSYMRRHKESLPVHPRASFRRLALETFKVLLPMTIPATIIGSILAGIATPTESAVVAIAIATILGVVYRELTFQGMADSMVSTAVTAAPLLLIVATGNVLGWGLAMEQVPIKATELLLSLSDRPGVVLFLIMLLILFTGMIMDGIAAITILVPVLLPVVKKLGIDPLHFGLLVSMNLIIGLITPPVGLVLYTCVATTGVTLERLVRIIWPLVLVCIGILFFLAYVPDLVLFLPRLLMGYGR